MSCKTLKQVFVALLMTIALLPSAAIAQNSVVDILKTLNFRAGQITLGDNLAEIDLLKNFRFLDNHDTQTFLTKIWRNPPGAGERSLGMIIPIEPSPLSADGWAVVVTYEATGYVSDSDAGKINYDELMKEMQQAIEQANVQRSKQGYEKIQLVGWARKPYYDSSAKKMFWAKRLRFGDSSRETLNYEIRVLGRRGVLDLNVVAPMSALGSIDSSVNTILDMVHFNKGNTYAEYDSNVDEAAAYGLAGLIAGGVLAKAGLFKGLLAILLASKKLIAVGLIALFGGLWAAIKRVFARGRKSKSPISQGSGDSNAGDS